MTPEAHAGETGGIRWLVAALPAPKGWDKNDRIGVVTSDTARQKRGTRFMIPAAREYRELVAGTVMPVLLAAGADRKAGWFRRSWGGVMLQFSDQSYDADHWSAGIQDDLCHSGLAKTDEACIGIFPLKLAAQPDGGIYLMLSEVTP